MNKKYKLTKETITADGHVLYRIQALRGFYSCGFTLHVGSLGGFVESEANLSQEGNCWIGYNAMVYGNAYVCDNAEIRGTSKIFGRALVKDKASIYSGALIYGHAKVKDRAQVGVDVVVKGSEVVGGNAVLLGPTK